MQTISKQGEETRDAFKELRMKYCGERGNKEVGPTELALLTPLRKKYPHQSIFLQAVEEMAKSLAPLFADKEKGDFYQRAFSVMAEPERIVSFRVLWIDDAGHLNTNRGWQVQFSSVLGPFKGGLRFHPSVDEGVLKFLGFEQTFKNALTGLRMGGGKGGSDFDPKGKSDSEVRRFCQAFMTELSRHIHPSTYVPAGDIGVGARELGYLYGQYKRLTNRHGDGVLTGKPISLAGSELRPEATGFGLAYMAKLAIEDNSGTLENARCAVSGSGNVAIYTVKKLMEFGAKVISLSDSGGCLIFKNGMMESDWNVAIEAKEVKRARLSSLVVNKLRGGFVPGCSPWSVTELSLDYAFPCATENEIDGPAAKRLIQNGMKGIFEGANLPTTLEGQKVIRENKMLYVPGKAANAGGVAVSNFEMAQNAQISQWSKEDVEEKLQSIMKSIYEKIKKESFDENCTLEEAADRVGFLKTSEAMAELGWIW